MKATKLIALSAFATLAACGNGDDKQSADSDTDSQVACPWDDDSEPAKAIALNGSAEGYICPIGDQDWYSIVQAQNNGLMAISLEIEAPVAPIGPTYTLWDVTGTEVIATPAASESAGPGEPIHIVHGVTAGRQYLLSVRDSGGDGTDTRHPYLLTVEGLPDPDSNEPNDDETAASDLSGSQDAYISYRGDQDWYAVDAPERGLLDIRLTMPIGAIEPAFRVIDLAGETMITQSNPSGTVEATELTRIQPVEDAGIYYVVVEDDDNVEYDTEVPYTLQVAVANDPDLNEPNDHPTEATEIPAQMCVGSWSNWENAEGYLASSGDIDWYHVPLSSCGTGIIEIEVTFDDPATLPANLDVEVRIVRNVDMEICQVDQDCQELSQSCGENIECAHLGNTCLASGRCAGSGQCLGTGDCGATLLSATADAANPGYLLTSAPLQGYADVWFAVVDHLGNALSVDNPYSMQVRVRDQPDLEPSELYTAGPPVANNAGYHSAYAQTIPVHDCRLGYDCCDGGTWETGAIGYAFDQDWFKYQHPCPGQDCMVRIHYEFDAGPTDLYLRIFADTSLWYDTITGTSELANQGARAGIFGGLAPSDECFYAYDDHIGSPFWYHLAVRDTIWVDAGNPMGGTWDWDAEQEYRLCVETIADGCLSPCEVWDPAGCGPPYP